MKPGRVGPTLIGTERDPLENRLAFRLINPDEVWPLAVLEKNWRVSVGLLWSELNARTQSRKASRRSRTSFADAELRGWIAQTRRLCDSFDVPGQFPDSRQQLRRIADSIEYALDHEPAILRRSRFAGPDSVLERRFNLFLWGWERMRWLFNSYTNPPIFGPQEQFWTMTLESFPPAIRLLDAAAMLKRIQRVDRQLPSRERTRAFVWFLQALRLGPVRIDGSSSELDPR